jgi:hypothetical protein
MLQRLHGGGGRAVDTDLIEAVCRGQVEFGISQSLMITLGKQE